MCSMKTEQEGRVRALKASNQSASTLDISTLDLGWLIHGTWVLGFFHQGCAGIDVSVCRKHELFFKAKSRLYSTRR